MLATLALLLQVALPSQASQDPPEPSPGETAQAAQEPEGSPQEGPDADAAASEAGAVEPPPRKTASEWLELAGTLADAIERGEARTREADALYPVLVDELEERLKLHRGEIRHARSTSDEIEFDVQWADENEFPGTLTVADLYQGFVRLYEARLRLLEVVSPGLRASATGIDVEGVSELKLELTYLQRHARYQRLATPEGMRRVLHQLRIAPIPWIRALALLIVGLLVFRGWRKWAKTGLDELRRLVASTWSDEAWARALASFLWYVERVRRPLEWLGLSALFFALLKLDEVSDTGGVLRIVVTWILLAWFAVLQVDALATRATSPSKLERSPARTRSLGVVATWLVFLGLGLHLADHLTGRATTFTWIFRVFQLLGLPVLAILLWLWKPGIRQRMERQARFSPWVEKHLRRHEQHFGLIETAVGSIYLITVWLRRAALRLLRKSALGRTLVAEALRQRMVRGGEGLPEATRWGFSDPAIRNQWLYGKRHIESPIKKELEQVRDMVERGWPTIVVVAERGGGKTSFLRRLAQEYGDRAVIADCGHGSAESALASLGRSLGIEDASASTDAIVETLREKDIRIVAWDDLHRLCRPVLGGQAALDRIADALGPSQGKLTSIVSVDTSAWQYMRRVREGSITGPSVIELPAWTEGQIGELIEARADEVEIELSYHRLSFPRMLLEHDFDTPEEGLRASFRRLLWSEAAGNPFVAMRLLADALIVETDGRLAVQLPTSPSAGELEGVRLVTLLVLRLVLQTDGATSEELVAGLRYPPGMIRSAIITAAMRGWIEERDARHYITWEWFRTITTVLARRNFLASSRQGVESAHTDMPTVRMPRRRTVYAGRYAR